MSPGQDAAGSPRIRQPSPEAIRQLGWTERLFWLLDRNSPRHFVLAAQVDGHTTAEEWRKALDAVGVRYAKAKDSDHFSNTVNREGVKVEMLDDTLIRLLLTPICKITRSYLKSDNFISDNINSIFIYFLNLPTEFMKPLNLSF